MLHGHAGPQEHHVIRIFHHVSGLVIRYPLLPVQLGKFDFQERKRATTLQSELEHTCLKGCKILT